MGRLLSTSNLTIAESVIKIDCPMATVDPIHTQTCSDDRMGFIIIIIWQLHADSPFKFDDYCCFFSFVFRFNNLNNELLE